MKLLDHFTSHSYFRNFIFWIGTIRRLHDFPWITWDHHTPKVSHEEIDEIIKLLQPGDVGVHLDEGFLSNLFIPGRFKHAWIHTEGDRIIEATSQGVLEKSCRYPLRTDELVILRPKVSMEAKLEAVERARKIKGFVYDVEFDFDLKEEFNNLNKHDQAFSCIEVIAYAYYPHFEELKFKWNKKMNKQVLYPDTVINEAWDVVYSNVSEIPKTL